MVKHLPWLFAFDIPAPSFPDNVRARAIMGVLGVLLLGLVAVVSLLAYGLVVRRRLKRDRLGKTPLVEDKWYASGCPSSSANPPPEIADE